MKFHTHCNNAFLQFKLLHALLEYWSRPMKLFGNILTLKASHFKHCQVSACVGSDVLWNIRIRSSIDPLRKGTADWMHSWSNTFSHFIYKNQVLLLMNDCQLTFECTVETELYYEWWKHLWKQGKKKLFFFK